MTNLIIWIAFMLAVIAVTWAWGYYCGLRKERAAWRREIARRRMQ